MFSFHNGWKWLHEIFKNGPTQASVFIVVVCQTQILKRDSNSDRQSKEEFADHHGPDGGFM